jgi:myosin heavy subunit
VAAVLHLGNSEFVEDPDVDGGCKLATPSAQQHLAWAAELLSVSAQGLLHALSTRTRLTPDGPIVSPITASAAGANRDALAKTIYSRLFDWLVQQVHLLPRPPFRSFFILYFFSSLPAVGHLSFLSQCRENATFSFAVS